MSTSRKLGRTAIEFVRRSLVALLMLPFIIQYGKLQPWQPSTIDLQVYVAAVKDMLAGRNIFATTTPFWNLYFIYPPIAAILMTPLAFGPYVFWQVVWTAGLVWAQQSVLKRCGVPRGWKLGLIGIAVVLAVEPIRTTLGYGQVNTMLMALVVADLLPDAPGERRRIPQGTLIGLAAAIKLTPMLFVVFAFLIGKRRVAVTGADQLRGLHRDRRDPAVLRDGGVLRRPVRRQHPDGLAVVRRQPVAARGVLPARRLLPGHHADRARHRRPGGPARLPGRGVLVARRPAGVRGRPRRALHLPGLAAVLDPPLRLDPADGGGRLSGRGRRSGPGCSAASGWSGCAVCLPLAVLPYGGGRERHFDGLQQLVANLGPVLGVILVAGLAWQLVITTRSPRLVGAGSRTPTPSPDRSRRVDRSAVD